MAGLALEYCRAVSSCRDTEPRTFVREMLRYLPRIYVTLMDLKPYGEDTDADADADENFAQNLINDISFEYMLNRSGSMYVRLFRHVGYESILEGEITQTGVGFVLRRKINSFRDIFRLRRPPKKLPPLEKAATADTAATPVVSKEIDTK